MYHDESHHTFFGLWSLSEHKMSFDQSWRRRSLLCIYCNMEIFVGSHSHIEDTIEVEGGTATDCGGDDDSDVYRDCGPVAVMAI